MGYLIDTCIWIDVERGIINPFDVSRYTIAGVLNKRGHGSDFRIKDLWIASQAIQYGVKILTRNEKDFMDIPGVELEVFESNN